MPTREHARLALRLVALLGASAWTGTGAFAADLQVERLELITHGSFAEDSGSFEAASRLFFDLSIAGGDKFGGLLRLDYLNGDIEKALSLAGQAADDANFKEKLDNLTSPRFRTASITAKNLFDLPLDASYFVGYLDAFCSGEDYVSLFGTAPFSTALKGPMVYPEGVGGNANLFYDGIHAVNGTGLRLGTSPKLSPSLLAYLYLYQDADLGVGSWSGDFRALYNSPKVKFEAFAGGSVTPPYGIYRAGILFFAAPGDVGEFFLQAGVPYWDPADTLQVDNLYFLFEPRINFGFGNLALTVFYHPMWYRQQENASEKSCLDTAINLRLGRLSEQGMQGGMESLLKFRPYSDTPLSVDISPYYSMIAGGVEWDFKLGLNLFPMPSPWYGIFEPYIGLKTSF